jgi:hypothetical protein
VDPELVPLAATGVAVVAVGRLLRRTPPGPAGRVVVGASSAVALSTASGVDLAGRIAGGVVSGAGRLAGGAVRSAGDLAGTGIRLTVPAAGRVAAVGIDAAALVAGATVRRLVSVGHRTTAAPPTDEVVAEEVTVVEEVIVVAPADEAAGVAPDDAEDPAPGTGAEDELVTVGGGARYHRPTCRMAKDMTEQVPVSYARGLGLTACGICRP